MDRTKYGRRLTFLNAYFSLAIVIVPLLGIVALLCEMRKFNPIWAIWGLHSLYLYAWRCIRQILELRAGIPVEDKRGWQVPAGAVALRGAILASLGIFALIVGVLVISLMLLSTPTPRPSSRDDLWVIEVVLCVLGTWASLWLSRAGWEWRVNQGTVRSSECVERTEEGISLLPHTEAGLRRYISELTWLVRLAPWATGLLLVFPGFFLSVYNLSSIAGGAIFSIVVLVWMSQHWKQAHKDRDACQAELEQRLALTAPIRTKVVAEQTPVLQQLRRP